MLENALFIVFSLRCYAHVLLFPASYFSIDKRQGRVYYNKQLNSLFQGEVQVLTGGEGSIKATSPRAYGLTG